MRRVFAVTVVVNMAFVLGGVPALAMDPWINDNRGAVELYRVYAQVEVGYFAVLPSPTHHPPSTGECILGPLFPVRGAHGAGKEVRSSGMARRTVSRPGHAPQASVRAGNWGRG